MRRLRVLLFAVLCLVGALPGPRPAEAHTDVCVGQGIAETSAGLGHAGIHPTTTVNFAMYLSVGTCITQFWDTAYGTLTGNCYFAQGTGFTESGHYFRITWLGEEWVMGVSTDGSSISHELPVLTENALVGAGDLSPDPVHPGSCTNATATRFLLTGTWSSPLHPSPSGPPPPPNYPPNPPEQVSPASGYTFGQSEAQKFVVRATDPEGNQYQGRINVKHAATGSTAATYYTAPAASGSDATAVATPPLPPGDYTWSADATDDLVPTSGFGGASAESPFTVAGAGSGVYPSDDCAAGGSSLANGTAGGTFVRLQTKQPDPTTTWVCYRMESGSVRQGGKLAIGTGSPSSPTAPSVEQAFTPCASPGNTVPGPHPTFSGSVGDPADPSTYVPFATDVYASMSAVKLCLKVGTTARSVVVPVPQTGTPPSVVHYPDPTGSHVSGLLDNPGPASGTCQEATTGSKAEHANLQTAAGTLWLHTWQESATRSHVCVRSQGVGATGGRLTIDTAAGTPSPTVTTSTTDTVPCTLRVVGTDTPTTVELRRSASLTDTSGVSFCVVAATTRVRVTAGVSGGASPPQATWTPDP